MKSGIDYGTCFSSTLLLIGDATFDPENSMGVPTLFMHVAKENKDYFGEECENQRYALTHPQNVIRNIKTMARMEPEKLNDPKAIVSDGKTYSIKEATKCYLDYLLSKAKNDSRRIAGDDTLQDICITAPVSSGSDTMLSTEYRDMLMDILSDITGLDDKHIFVLPEPVAAAISYFNVEEKDVKKDVDEQSILVFDLGGGTLDITVMTYSCKNNVPHYSVKKIDGNPNLGGNLWDDALAKFVLKEKFGLDPNGSVFGDEVEEHDFKKMITNAKIELSKLPKVMCTACIKGDIQSTFVTVEEFEKSVSDLVDQTMTLTKKVVDTYEGGIKDIDKIILVGGSSNMPHIREAIENTFPSFNKDNILVHEPSKAIAKGAAIYLDLIAKRPGFVTTGFGYIAANTYGWSSINSSKTPHREMIYNVLMKETPFSGETISMDAETAFHAVDDDQEKVCFTVYESNVTKDECEDGHWINFGPGQKTCGIEVTVPVPSEFHGKARSYHLYPRMILDRNGILKLEVYDEDYALIASDQKSIHGKKTKDNTDK